MPEVTEESIRSAVSQAKPLTVVLLRRGPNYDTTQHLHMEHLKHIFTMRDAGQQVLTLPVTEQGSDLVGIGLFATGDKAEALRLTNEDPGVKAGRFTVEVLGCMGLPGDRVP